MKERQMINPDARSVEQVTLRNNVFIVHTLAEGGVQHHNANSNVSEKATYEDDIDIMLALEPSVSASSVTPGKKATLWSADGFLLTGGHISEAASSDRGTFAHGIKKRGGDREDTNSSVEEIDTFLGRKGQRYDDNYGRIGFHSMNEAVVNNPEVFGFFQQAEKDADGRYWAYNLGTKKDRAEAAKMRRYRPAAFDTNLANYRRRFAVAQERGVPLYIMTPDREVYECLGVNDDGTVETGRQLTPQEVAAGRAGWSSDKRKEVGEKLLQKGIFRGEKTQEEAKQIIGAL